MFSENCVYFPQQTDAPIVSLDSCSLFVTVRQILSEKLWHQFQAAEEQAEALRPAAAAPCVKSAVSSTSTTRIWQEQQAQEQHKGQQHQQKEQQQEEQKKPQQKDNQSLISNCVIKTGVRSSDSSRCRLQVRSVEFNI
ncbi:hypothetical protein Emag_005708 [Eimeria magna]